MPVAMGVKNNRGEDIQTLDVTIQRRLELATALLEYRHAHDQWRAFGKLGIRQPEPQRPEGKTEDENLYLDKIGNDSIPTDDPTYPSDLRRIIEGHAAALNAQKEDGTDGIQQA